MATYREIQSFIKDKHNIIVQTCWIAHMKEKLGLPKRTAVNRISEYSRVKPCLLNMRFLLRKLFAILG